MPASRGSRGRSPFPPVAMSVLLLPVPLGAFAPPGVEPACAGVVAFDEPAALPFGDAAGSPRVPFAGATLPVWPVPSIGCVLPEPPRDPGGVSWQAATAIQRLARREILNRDMTANGATAVPRDLAAEPARARRGRHPMVPKPPPHPRQSRELDVPSLRRYPPVTEPDRDPGCHRAGVKECIDQPVIAPHARVILDGPLDLVCRIGSGSTVARPRPLTSLCRRAR
jgi:hypothetical protein